MSRTKDGAPPRRRRARAARKRTVARPSRDRTAAHATRGRATAGPPRAVVVLSTAGSRGEAERIARALVDERLAACVNVVGPITSIYRWHGVVERAEEMLLVVKTRRTLAERVATRIRTLHSYDLPEAIVLPIDGGAADYLAWIAAETS